MLDIKYEEKPNREKLHLQMELQFEAAEKYSEELKTLLTSVPKGFRDGDTLKINYTCFISYLGNVSDCLSAVNTICKDADIVTTVDCELLEQNQCLVYETLKNLESLIATVRGRTK